MFLQNKYSGIYTIIRLTQHLHTLQRNYLKECVFINSALKIQCHIVKRTLDRLRFCPLGIYLFAEIIVAPMRKRITTRLRHSLDNPICEINYWELKVERGLYYQASNHFTKIT